MSGYRAAPEGCTKIVDGMSHWSDGPPTQTRGPCGRPVCDGGNNLCRQHHDQATVARINRSRVELHGKQKADLIAATRRLALDSAAAACEAIGDARGAEAVRRLKETT